EPALDLGEGLGPVDLDEPAAPAHPGSPQPVRVLVVVLEGRALGADEAVAEHVRPVAPAAGDALLAGGTRQRDLEPAPGLAQRAGPEGRPGGGRRHPRPPSLAGPHRATGARAAPNAPPSARALRCPRAPRRRRVAAPDAAGRSGRRRPAARTGGARRRTGRAPPARRGGTSRPARRAAGRRGTRSCTSGRSAGRTRPSGGAGPRAR